MSLEQFADIVKWRRDVRRFRTQPVPPETLARLLSLADLAPSVGNSQPWRIVIVETPVARQAIRANFETANAAAAAIYPTDAERAEYCALKLAGFDAAPVHLAVYSDLASTQGRGLGIQSMPEMLAYSCVSMITTLWYAARTEGIGLGWVSILSPTDVSAALKIPTAWQLIGYLLLGYPLEQHLDPELERAGWQARTPTANRILTR